MSKIISVNLVNDGGSFSQTAVVVKFDNAVEKTIFNYFPDELHFSESEFIGKTEEEAIALFHKKDLAYLQS